MSVPAPAFGRVLHTGNLVVDVNVHVPHLPRSGEDLPVTGFRSTPGGAWHTLAAASGLGATCVYGGRLGTGPHGTFLSSQLDALGVMHPAPLVSNRDSGVSLALIEPDGERTFLSETGAEAALTHETLDALHPTAQDAIVVSGYTLPRQQAGAELVSWLTALPDDARVLFDPGPMVQETSADRLRAVCQTVSVLTGTLSEEQTLAERLGIHCSADGPEPLTAALHDQLPQHPLVLLHLGVAGALWADNRGGGRVPALPVTVRSANGAGDTVAGVLAWALAGPWLSAGAHRDAVREVLDLAMAAAARHISTPDGTPPANRATLHEFQQLHRSETA